MKLSEILEEGASRFGSDVCAAAIDGGNTATTRVLTYESAWKVLLQHRNWLMNHVHPHEKKNILVAYLSGNSIDFLLSVFACTSFDEDTVTAALLNTRWTPSEMAAALQTNDLSAKTIILYGPGFQQAAQTASNLLSHSSCTLAIPTLSEPSMTQLQSSSLPFVNTYSVNKDIDTRIQQVSDSQDGNDDAVIVFTSGTTGGGAKGVRLSHKALYVQALAKLRPPCGYSRQTRMLGSTVPLFHVGGLSSTLSVLLAGGTWILSSSSQAGFEPATVLESVSCPTLPVNTLVVVPAILHSILGECSEDDSFDAVRLILIGGQSASPETLRRVKGVFPNARIVQTFACTEAASSLTFLDIQPTNFDTLSVSLPEGPSGDCVGVPPPHVELVLMHKDRNGGLVKVKQPYEVGIFSTRGPHVMNGYWKRNASNHQNREDSWYLTNDLGFFDDQGQFYFCGRTKDVIRTGGETVIALEVERILLGHPSIGECAVFALPDERFGETVCVAIVCSDDTNSILSLSDIRAFCTRQGLAGYKKPRQLFFVKELPRNSSGKIVKHKLVERFRVQKPIRSRL